MEVRVGKKLAVKKKIGHRSAAKKIDCVRMLVKRKVKRRMKKRRIIQPMLWTERPTGAVMVAGSIW